MLPSSFSQILLIIRVCTNDVEHSAVNFDFILILINFDFILCNSNFDFISYYNLLLCFIPLEMHVRLIRAIKFYLSTYLLTDE